MFMWHLIRAVSYTHLDVYKRQGYLYYNGVNNNYNFVPNKYDVDQLKELKDNRLFSTCSLIPFGKTQAEAGVTDGSSPVHGWH